MAQSESFHVLRERARKTKLEAEHHRGLAERQHAARSARSYGDELGMVHIHMELEPHVGAPIVARAEAEAQRLARKAKAADIKEPFECHLADAYAALLSGTGKGRAKRPELVILVSHEVAKRGWTRRARRASSARSPGLGRWHLGWPGRSPKTRSSTACSTTGWTCATSNDGRGIPRLSYASALELGEPPEFDGVVCIDCGNRFRTEFDHVEPHVARGPASNGNLKPRCYRCHQAKTERDRKAGKLKPPEP